jgi:sorbitol-specific phosphotransferase system component IIC
VFHASQLIGGLEKKISHASGLIGGLEKKKSHASRVIGGLELCNPTCLLFAGGLKKKEPPAYQNDADYATRQPTTFFFHCRWEGGKPAGTTHSRKFDD